MKKLLLTFIILFGIMMFSIDQIITLATEERQQEIETLKQLANELEALSKELNLENKE